MKNIEILKEYKTKIKEHLKLCNKCTESEIEELFEKYKNDFDSFFSYGYMPCTVAGMLVTGLVGSV